MIPSIQRISFKKEEAWIREANHSFVDHAPLISLSMPNSHYEARSPAEEDAARITCSTTHFDSVYPVSKAPLRTVSAYTDSAGEYVIRLE
ncbi:hypothetical protein E1B28_006204 [Marasmius oreades]|uniref:Uncharacterized protein n=1 Tax=Marasmius oreades TaxID=181124 RepID=A0A9P7UWC3_9AGAR|nr:uncharacterized protein E1B28_006204 [Marasmius oreades]KAG7095464.1 hypothetical protein E1B28_006204 [Marasmius oreades]